MKNSTHQNSSSLNEDQSSYDLANSTYKVRRMTQNRPRKDGLVKIEIEIERYSYGGKGKNTRKKIFIDTQQWVSPKNWNNKTQKLSKKEPDSEVKSNKINSAFAAVHGFVSSKGKQEIDQSNVEEVNFNKLRELFPNRKENRKSFVDWIDNFHKRKVKQGLSRGTTKEFITVKNRVNRYDISKNKKTYLEDINLLWSEDFYTHLLNVEKYKEGTIGKTFEIVRHILKYFYKRKKEFNIELEPYFLDEEFMWGEKSKNKPNALSFDQRAILFKHRFGTKPLERTRKMMCLQAFTGVRYGDISRIRPDHIKGGFLVFTPKKTERHKVEVVQPLNSESKTLLEEVDWDTSVYTLSNQKYNDSIANVINALRKAYPKAEYREKYASHNMRDTFISVCVHREVNFKSILLWVGQSSYAIMDRYVELTDEFNKKEMGKTQGAADFSEILRKSFQQSSNKSTDYDDLPI